MRNSQGKQTMTITTPNAYIPAVWQTARLQIVDSTLADVSALTAIYTACSYAGQWDPSFKIIPESELAGLVTNSLDTSPEHINYRLQAIRVAETGELVGYFHCYHGIPRDRQTVWISMFVIHPDYRKQHYGQEVVQGFLPQFQALGYRAVQLEAFVQNWPALRFWTNQGFTTILKYVEDVWESGERCDSLILENTFAPQVALQPSRASASASVRAE